MPHNELQSETPEENSSEELKLSHYFLLIVLAVVLYLCYQIIKPYQHVIIIATILAMVFSPIHHRIVRWVKGRRTLAATISCILLTLVVALPLLIMSTAIIQQGISSFDAISEWISTGKYKELENHSLVLKTKKLYEKMQPRIQKYFPNFNPAAVQLDQALVKLSTSVGTMLVNQGGHILGNLTSLTMKFILIVFTFFYIIRDEEEILATILHYSPLSLSQEERIIDKIRAVAKSALLGTFVTALAQGVAGGIAFWICGIPALFWGMVMAFASLIPVVGTALIWVPAAGYLFISGHWGYGIFLVAWCAIVVGMIDNLVRPIFMTGSAGMSSFFIFFSILGGLSYFGLLGVLYGPLLFGLAMVLFLIYEVEFSQFLSAQDAR